MKVLTHNVFSFGLAVFLLSRTGFLSWQNLLMALWLTFAINYVIDIVGHKRRDGIPVRTVVTHSIFTAPIWGFAVAAVSATLPYSAMGLRVDQGFFLVSVALGVLLAYSHLLLDALSEAGIFYFRHRIALMHFGYNNPAVNTLCIAIGAVLLVLGLGAYV